MNLDGHLRALTELKETRRKLDPVADLRTYAETGHGIALHTLAERATDLYGDS